MNAIVGKPTWYELATPDLAGAAAFYGPLLNWRFRDAGMEGFALKGLGHGIGLEIHEHPRVVIAGAHVLKAGMVFTVEPGLYIPGSHGVRTEDDVLVVAGGVENLCTLPHHIPVAQ